MTRPPRLEFAGARYHVINRGNYRRDIFRDDGAAEAFERTLGEAAERFGWRVAAYVVMRNHFHLALETPEPNLSLGMKWLLGTWVRRFNRFRSFEGRPFQGRFKSLVIEDAAGYRRVCDYIHLNPVRAKVVSASEAANYRRCSLWRYVNGLTPAWLDGAWRLQAGGFESGVEGWRAYSAMLAAMMEDALEREELSAKKLSRGWCIGGVAFKKSLQETMRDQLADWRERRFAGLDPDERNAERILMWEEALLDCARAAKIDLANLPAKKSAPEKVVLAAALKQISSVSNGWLAERLLMGKAASASQFVRRGLQNQALKAQVQAVLSKVKE